MEPYFIPLVVAIACIFFLAMVVGRLRRRVDQLRHLLRVEKQQKADAEHLADRLQTELSGWMLCARELEIRHGFTDRKAPDHGLQ